ncbi:MAG: helix-turn-helix domain-containing protein [Oscillospiraceae bacterium]|nr:helix-turn-helix domain-containing protein [Oscillospiraceae bacterium]
MNNAQTAEIIRKRCTDKKIPVKVLLEECGIRKGFIYDLEKRNNAPLAETLEKIAIHLGCSVDYLIGLTDNPEINK